MREILLLRAQRGMGFRRMEGSDGETTEIRIFRASAGEEADVFVVCVSVCSGWKFAFTILMGIVGKLYTLFAGSCMSMTLVKPSEILVTLWLKNNLVKMQFKSISYKFRPLYPFDTVYIFYNVYLMILNATGTNLNLRVYK